MSTKKQGVQTVKIPGFHLNPLYQWDDGWWIGRVVLTGEYISFVLVDSTSKAMSIVTIRKASLGVSGAPVTMAGRTLTKGMQVSEAEEEALAVQKRWYPFLRDYLWNIDVSDFSPQELPVFVPDGVFERAAQIDDSDLKTEYDLAVSVPRAAGLSKDPVDRSAIDMLESVFATHADLLFTFGASLQIQGTEFQFWWEKSGRDGWGVNRISSKESGEVGGRTLSAYSLGDLVTKLSEANILLPASKEAAWGPPGQLSIDVDFSMYKMLGMPSPILESNAVYSEWIKALDTVT